MNTPVTFNTAKLLKEKGFDKRAEKRYGTQSGILYNDAVINDLEDDVFTAAPTIAEVIMWLYEKHGIWISVLEHNKNGKGIYFESFVNSMTFSGYNSPTEAYQEAINYTLKNLIK